MIDGGRFCVMVRHVRRAALDALRPDTALGPGHVFDSMAGLHRCDDAELREPRDVGRAQHLRMLDPMAARARGWILR